MAKKFDIKKFISNNAIILLIAALAIFVGCNSQNFFTFRNLNNLIVNVSPRFIIACGVFIFGGNRARTWGGVRF